MSAKIEQLVDARPVAEALGKSEQWVKRQARVGAPTIPPAVRIGRSFRWRPSAVARWVADHEQGRHS